LKKYISLLRGINVSGQKKIKMVDLKTLYETLGFTDVLTYIQSGNVIFNSEIKDKFELITKLEEAVQTRYCFHVPVQICTLNDLNDVLSKLPFKNLNADEDGAKVYISFLSEKPATEKVPALQTHVVEPEKLVVNDQIVYLYCPNGYGRTKLSNTFIEKKLGVAATTRNLRTVAKLSTLAMNK
jgi:uncharacterized protein (DUF1697 family)